MAISGKLWHLPPVALGTESRHVTQERARKRVQCLREQQVVLLWGMGTQRCGEHLHARRGGSSVAINVPSCSTERARQAISGNPWQSVAIRGNQRTVLLLVRQKKFVRLAWSSEEGAIS